jgi:hypothetical protein
MSEKDIEAKDIDIAQKEAHKSAIRLNKALGLSYYKVKNDKLYEVFPDGKERLIGKSRFGTRKVEKKHFELKSND